MIRTIIVDDDQTDAFLLESALRMCIPDISITTVPSVASAISTLLAFRPEERTRVFLVTDLVMPASEPEGVVLIRWATSFLSVEGSTVIAITGAADTVTRQRAIDAGASMVLDKPENYDGLLDLARMISSGVTMVAA